MEDPDRGHPGYDVQDRLAAAEAALNQLRRRAAIEHRRHLAAIEDAVAADEHRARREAEHHRRAIRAELMRGQSACVARPPPAVDLSLASDHLDAFRIVPL